MMQCRMFNILLHNKNTHNILRIFFISQFYFSMMMLSRFQIEQWSKLYDSFYWKPIYALRTKIGLIAMSHCSSILLESLFLYYKTFNKKWMVHTRTSSDVKKVALLEMFLDLTFCLWCSFLFLTFAFSRWKKGNFFSRFVLLLALLLRSINWILN